MNDTMMYESNMSVWKRTYQALIKIVVNECMMYESNMSVKKTRLITEELRL